MNISKSTKIAIIGVSQNIEKYGYKIFQDLLVSGYSVEGVNSKGGNILEKEMFFSLEKLSKSFGIPDLVITVVPPKVTEDIVDDSIKLGVKNIWMQPGSESDLAIEKAKRSGLYVISNACFMKQENIW